MARKLKRKNLKAQVTNQSSRSKSREDRKTKFLAARKFGASVVQAARWAGVPRATAYRWRQRDPEFAQAWEDPEDHVLQSLEFEAFKRAIDGNDRLLLFLLKSYDRAIDDRRLMRLLSQRMQQSHYEEDEEDDEDEDEDEE